MPDNTNKSVDKERALFFLDRRLRELETQIPNQEAMAEAGLSYAERQRMGTQADAAESEAQLELGALRWARNVVQGVKT